MSEIQIYSAAVCPFAQRTRLERQGISKLSAGPYWLGEFPSLVDFAFYPWFERWPVIEHYRHLAFPTEYTRLQQWWHVMQTRNAIQAIAHSEEFYLKQYAEYVKN